MKEARSYLGSLRDSRKKDIKVLLNFLKKLLDKKIVLVYYRGIRRTR